MKERGFCVSTFGAVVLWKVRKCALGLSEVESV